MKTRIHSITSKLFLIATFLIILLSFTNNISASDANPTSGTCGENVVWEFEDDGTLYISGTGDMANYTSKTTPWYLYDLDVKTVIISNGVTSIGDGAFGDTNLKNITIPESVVSIGSGAFSRCALNTITLPNSVRTIGNGAFSNCSVLKSVILPDGLIRIEDSTFYYCTDLTEITLPSTLTSIGESAFYYCVDLTDISLPKSIESIESYAFYNCDHLMNITLPHSINSIGTSIFEDCDRLTNVIWSNSLYTISQGTFLGCDNLTSITMHDAITTIEAYAFHNCPSLTSVDLPESLKVIEECAFSSCTNLISIVIPGQVTMIKNDAFFLCDNLNDITIPESVTGIGDYAFYGCSNISDIFYCGTKEDWLKISIGMNNESLVIENIIWGKYTITYNNNGGDGDIATMIKVKDVSLELSDRAPVRHGYSFEGWATSVDGNVEYISGATYSDNADITLYAVWKANTYTISYNANGGNDAPESQTKTHDVNLTLSSAVPTRDGYTFKGWSTTSTGAVEYAPSATCSANSDVTLYAIWDITIVASGICGENLVWILDSFGVLDISGEGAMTNYSNGNHAPWYNWRSKIKAVKIGEGISSIGSYAFDWCTSLADITISNSVLSIEDYAFVNCNHLTELTVPNGVMYIKFGAFASCLKLTHIKIPNSVTSIEDKAFSACDSLESIEVSDNNASYSSNNGVLYTKDKTILIQYPIGKENEYFEIPEGVKVIGISAFDGCSALTNIVIPVGVTTIEESAFSGTGLVQISIPDTVISIGESAFSYCRQLNSIDIPRGVEEILFWTFSYCSNLKNVLIPNGVTTIGRYAFNNCTNLSNLFLPDSITTIGECAFAGCSQLTDIVISKNVTSIGRIAFRECISLSSINVAEDNNYFSSDAGVLYNKNKTTLIHYPAGKNDTTFIIPSSVKSIKTNAFIYCGNLISVEIGDNVTKFEDYAISGCANLKIIGYANSCAQEFANNNDIPFEVIVVPVSGIVLDPPDMAMELEEVRTLSTTIYPSNATNKSLIWTSSNESVASVLNGVVTATGVGTTTITATTEDGGYTATCAVTVTEPKAFAPTFSTSMQANLTLEANVFLNIYFKLENLGDVNPISLQNRVGLLIWNAEDMPNDVTYENCNNVISGGEYDSSDGRFKVQTDGIPAKELGDAISFRAYFLNDDGTYTYGKIVSNYCPSVYCYRQLQDSNTADDELMITILNYGAAAQEFFNYRTDSLMNADLTEAQKTISWDGSLVRSDWSVPTNKAGSFVRNSKITSRSANLTLLGAIDYNFYVGIDSSVTVASAKILCWTESAYNGADTLTKENASLIADMEYNSEKGRYEYKYEGLPAKMMFSPIYTCAVITDTQGNEYYGGVVPYCPERFAYISTNSSSVSDAEKKLAKCIAIYGNAAKKYFNA